MSGKQLEIGNLLTDAKTPSLASDGGSLEQLAKTFKDGLSENTRRAYAQDLRDCAHFLARHSGEVDPDVSELPEGAAYVARKLLPNGQGMANALVIGYRSYLGEKGRAPATVNRRLAAVRSLVKAARLFGIVTWKLEVSSVRSRSYRDTSGPGLKGFKRMMAKARADDTAKGVRDRAILRLLWDLALRRSEVVGLDVEDVDLERGRLMVHGKGRGEPELMTLPDGTKAALGRWLEVRGEHDGALFTNFDRASKGDGRLSGTSVYRMVCQRGEDADVKDVRPHGIRHAAITHALDKFDGDVRTVSKFSRHRDVRVLMTYDDNREDLGGEVACTVAAAV